MLWADKGLGVIIGELGVSTHFTSDDRATQLDNEKYYLQQVVKEARSRGFAPIAWDNNTFGNGSEMYGTGKYRQRRILCGHFQCKDQHSFRYRCLYE